MKTAWLWSSLVLVFVVMLVPVAAAGQDQSITAGWEGYGNRGYALFSPEFALEHHSGPAVTGQARSGDLTHFALVLRGQASYLYYTFPDTSGPTSVRSPGLSGGLGLRLQTRRLSFTIGPSYGVRWTRRTLATGSQLHILEHGVVGECDVFFQATPLTNLNNILSYDDANHYLWSRSGIKRQLTNKNFRGSHAILLGAEVTFQGNHDLRDFEVGPLLEFAFFRSHTSLQFRGGYSRELYPDNSVKIEPYLGVGFYIGF